MVADVTLNERRAAEASQVGFVTYKQQMSFGLHVIVMMAAFYMFGHIAGMALTNNKTYVSLISILKSYKLFNVESSVCCCIGAL